MDGGTDFGDEPGVTRAEVFMVMSQSAIKESRPMRPIVHGLFTLPTSAEERGHLIGGKCRKCGRVWFPRKAICDDCGGLDILDMEEISLSTRGKLVNFSKVYSPSPGSVIKPPYVASQIELPEGVMVLTVLATDDIEGISEDDIGREAEMVIEKLMETEEGEDVMTFKFRLL